MADACKVLAIHAHPDDIEMQCTGTLLLLKERGCDITVATMTPGDKGSAELGPQEIASVRRQEAIEAARIMKAKCHCLEFRDLEIVHDNESRRRVTEFLRLVRPDVILTAPPIDYMADHEMTSRLVRDAAFNASVPNYYTGAMDAQPPTDKVPHLYYMEAVDGVDWYGQPMTGGFHVDVSKVYQAKRDALACHKSQRDWLLRQHGVDEYLDMQERWGKRLGQKINVEYAEFFQQHLGHPYPHDNILLSLLGL